MFFFEKKNQKTFISLIWEHFKIIGYPQGLLQHANTAGHIAARF
jgi:hypothetical protein